MDNKIPIRRSAPPIAIHKKLQGKESIRHQYKTKFMQLGNLVPCTNKNGVDVISEEDIPNVGYQ